MKKKSVAIIGEGETEWFYFESLRLAKRYPFKISPGFAQHADISHMIKFVDFYVREQYDYVFCLLDMDRLLRVPKEMQIYQAAKKKYAKTKNVNVRFIETNPCTEFWFLLHFLPGITSKNYQTYEDVLTDLRRYLPGYEKSKKYFKRNNIYVYISQHGDLSRAMENSGKLRRLSLENPEDYKSYSEIHEVLTKLEKIARTR